MRLKNWQKQNPLGISLSAIERGLMMTFKVGDHAVYPGHGVGRIMAIETKEILGNKQTFYSILIIETGMKIMIPSHNVATVGLRPIISKDEAQKVLGILKEKNVLIFSMYSR